MNLSPVGCLRIFLPFALGYFLSYLYRTVNAVLAPDLVRELGLNPADLGLLTSAYFLAFAAAQLPLGILLDRYGPRRVEASLLLFAAAGALLFARATTLGELLCGRALIGLGVAACLMAAFKAFTQWFSREMLPFVNGIQMVSGGLGALAATLPVELALGITDWRGVFRFLSGVTLVAALAVFTIVPEKAGEGGGETLSQQMAGVGTVFSSRVFWRITPWAVAAQGAYLSLLGLWSGPWLRDVANYERLGVANTLMGISLTMIAGYFAFGTLAAHLGRRGIPAARVAAAGMAIFLGVQTLLIVQPAGLATPLWLLFGFFGTACILPYAVLSQQFPPSLTGRVNTGLNLLVFLAAFAAQWGVGAILGQWPATAAGGYDPTGYRWGFGLLVGLQLLGMGWYLVGGRGTGVSEAAR
ncbi:MAG: MFS transporter [Desulfuromonadales bacterium]|nr:MFS transporter [Desulfuromonadales bacterium]